ncbi:hypothetical protein TNCV_2117481 [Trichonephila clavipes]|nr:hypothetical protein TNCV_2117481 [Trichonephila clavipes]
MLVYEERDRVDLNHKEPMDLGRGRRVPCADRQSKIIGGRERGPPRRFEGSARKLTRIFLSICIDFFASSSNTRDRGCGGSDLRSPSPTALVQLIVVGDIVFFPKGRTESC